jgi:hypothetical protein
MIKLAEKMTKFKASFRGKNAKGRSSSTQKRKAEKIRPKNQLAE